MSNCQYCVQSSGETDRSAGEKEQTSSIQSPGGDGAWKPDQICRESIELEKDEAVERKVAAEKNVSDFCISFAKKSITGTTYRGKQKGSKDNACCIGSSFLTRKAPLVRKRSRRVRANFTGEKQKSTEKERFCERELKKTEQFTCF